MRLFPLVAISLLLAGTAAAGPSVKSLTKQFHRLDLNADETLSSSELNLLLPSGLVPWVHDTRAAMFEWFDSDASDSVDLGEWIDGQAAVGFARPDFGDSVRSDLDANGDGKLTSGEFKRVVGRYVPSKTAKAWYDESWGKPHYYFSGSFNSFFSSSSASQQ